MVKINFKIKFISAGFDLVLQLQLLNFGCNLKSQAKLHMLKIA